MAKTEVEKLQKVIDNLRKKRREDKKKYNDLISEIIQMKREIISELGSLEIKIRKIMNTGDMRR